MSRPSGRNAAVSPVASAAVAVRAEALESRILFAKLTDFLGRPHSGLVATGDVNGDGLPDVAIIHRDLAAHNVLVGGVKSKEDVYVWKIKTRLGVGDGTFSQGPSSELPLSDVYGIAAGDLDGDGLADVAITGTPKGDFGDDGSGKASPSDSVIVALFSNGKPGGFTDSTGALRDAVFRQDFGQVQPTRHLDIVANPGGGTPGGGGTIQAYFNPKEISVDKGVPPKIVNFELTKDRVISRRNSVDVDHLEEIDGFVAAGDLDGDGRADVVWDDASGKVAVISGGDRVRTVQDNPLYKGSDPKVNPLAGRRTIGVGDLDGDGLPDLIGVVGDDVYTSSITVGRQTPNTSFGDRVKLPMTGHSPNNATLAVGDVNGDGFPELVAASNSGVYVLEAELEAGKVRTFTWTQAAGPLKWMAPESLRLTDLNKDGRLDVLLTGDNLDPLLGPPRVYSLLASVDAKGHVALKLSGDRSDG